MSGNAAPEGHRSVTPYLVATDVDQLIEFLTATFGATEKERVPGQDGRTGHARVAIGDSFVMMGKAQAGFPALPCYVYVYVPDTDATYTRALGAGAASVQEPADAFYGDRTAAVKDPAGNTWMFATRQEKLTDEELSARAREHMP